MKYYRLINNTDPKVVGRLHGSQCYGEPQLDSRSYELLFGTNCEREFPCGLEINCLVLDGNAKVTDFISVGGLTCRNLLISQKAENLIRSFNLPPRHSFHDCFLNSSGSQLKMRFLGIFQNLLTSIDLRKTSFRVYDSAFSDEFYVLSFNSLEEIIIKQHEIAGIGKIVPNERYFLLEDNLKFDVFRIGHIDFNLYVSQRLKTAVESDRLLGIGFVESEYF